MEIYKCLVLIICSVLFSAFLASRVGRIMHDVPPTSSVFRHSYQVLLIWVMLFGVSLDGRSPSLSISQYGGLRPDIQDLSALHRSFLVVLVGSSGWSTEVPLLPDPCRSR